MLRSALIICLFLTLNPALAASEESSKVDVEAKQLFKQHCSTCHNLQADMRTPNQFQLAAYNPLVILKSLQSGKMQPQGAALSEQQKRTLVEGLTRKKIEHFVIAEAAYCETRKAPVTNDSAVHWAGWGGNAAANGFNHSDHISPTDVQNLELSWSFAFPGTNQARSQPAVIGETLYVGSAEGAVYALNATSGCIYWRINTTSAVRGAIEVGKVNNNTSIFFTARDTQTYAVNPASGEIIWQRAVRYESFSSVTGTPAYDDGKLFIPISSSELGPSRNPEYHCCTSSGGVVAVNANTGDGIWHMRVTGKPAVEVGKNPTGKIFAPSGAPVWASPTIDHKRGLLYIGTGENYTRPTTHTSDAILALSLATGETVWSYQATANDAWHAGCQNMPDNPPCDAPGPDLDFGMSPILATLKNGKDILLAGQKSAVVYAFDPDENGKLLWKTRVGKGSALGGIHWGMATDNQYVYVTNADRAAIINDVNPDEPMAPGTYALALESGKVIWSQASPQPICASNNFRCSNANSSAPSVLPGVVFSGDLKGLISAYATQTGELLWSYNTDQSFESVNRVPGKGGAIDGPGPTIANGMIYVNSGYGLFGQIAGNVLLAFKVKD